LKNKLGLRISGCFLLLLYLIGISPLVIVHHHEVNSVAYQEAKDYGKNVLGENAPSCTHQAHFSKAQEKCWICDHHTMAPQILLETEFFTFQPTFYKEYYFYHLIFHTQSVEHTFNKGPPTV